NGERRRAPSAASSRKSRRTIAKALRNWKAAGRRWTRVPAGGYASAVIAAGSIVMPTFVSDGINLAYETYGEGAPVLLIHGFGSSGRVNWVETGWTETLTAAGYQAITIDNRGHGESEKLYDPERYYPWLMADDAARLLAHLGIRSAPVIGYSMGARIAAF